MALRGTAVSAVLLRAVFRLMLVYDVLLLTAASSRPLTDGLFVSEVFLVGGVW